MTEFKITIPLELCTKQTAEIARLRAEVERLRGELEGAPEFQAVCSGLWYKNPFACGDISAIRYGGRALQLYEERQAERKEWFEKGALYMVEAGWCRHYPSDHVKEAAARRLDEEKP